MVNAFAAFGFAYLCLAFTALELSTFLDPPCGAGTGSTTSAEAPVLQLHSAAEVLPPLAAVGVLFVAVALIYHHLMGCRAVAVPVARAAGSGRRRSISRPVMFALCVSAGTLEFIVFGPAAAVSGGGAGHGEQARALGLAALHALPSAATVMFFCGMMLIVAGASAHVRPGGEAGGTGAVAGDGPVQGSCAPSPKVAAGAAVALVGLMAMVLALHGATCRY